MKKSMTFAALLSIAAISAPVEARKPPALTPMEMQALQSREYQATKDQVFSSVVSVFQDLGYQISAADMASGFITAGSANKNKTGFLEAMAGMRSSGGSRVTAFIETMPSGLTRARLNFMNTKNSSGSGSSSSKDTPVLDQKTYQVAFEHVEEALFERGALTKTAPAAAPAAQVPATANVPATASVPSATGVPAAEPSSLPK